VDFANHIIRLTESFGFWGYLIAFSLAFLESLAFIGGFVPGTTAIVLLGFMCYRGFLNIYGLMFVTVLGAILGDSVSYWLGSKGIKFFKKGNRFLKASHLEMGQKFFDKHGNKSIFLGRFIGIIRPMIPFAAGLSRMNYKVFLFWNVFSGIIWGVAHIYIGYFFGGAFKLIEAWSARVSVLLLILIAIVIIFWLLARAFTPTAAFIFRISTRMTDYVLGIFPFRNFIARFPATSAFIGRRFDRTHFNGLPMTLLVSTILAFMILFAMLADGILDVDPVTDLDQRVALFLVFFRDTILVRTFLWISLLGKIQIVLAIATSFIVVALIWNRRTLITSFIAMFATCEAAVWIIKGEFTRPRPVGIIPAYFEKTHSFPSEHSALAVLLYGFMCYFIVRLLLRERPHLSIWAIFMTFILISMIGFSRLYLGVHYFSDVIGGYLIGGICLVTGISLFEWTIQSGRGKVKDFSMDAGQKKILSILFIAIPFAFFFFYGFFIFKPEMIRGRDHEGEIVLAAKMSPQEIFLFNKWKKHTVGLSGRQREPISVMIWCRDDLLLADAFTMAGWKIPDQPSMKNIIKMGFAAAEKKPYDTAPVTPIFWLNQSNDMAFEKTSESLPQKHCFRIWNTDLVDLKGNRLYVGSCGKTNGKGSLDIASERTLIADDLNSTGHVAYMSVEKLGEPVVSSKKFAIKYIFDGNVANIILK